MYQLTIKETHGFKTWKLNIGETLPKCPSSFQSERSELKLAAIFFPDNSLKELFKTVLIESSHNYFSFQVDKIDAKNRKEETQTITIFKGMDVIPESGRELVLSPHGNWPVLGSSSLQERLWSLSYTGWRRSSVHD